MAWRKNFPLGSGLALALLLCGCEYFGGREDSKEPSYADVSANRLAQIKAGGSFKVAVCVGNPPFAMKEDGKLVGLELDIVNAIARELKLTPQFIEVPRNDASGMLRDGTCDLLCGSFDGPSITRQFLDSVLEYLPSGQRAIVRKEAADFLSSPQQLNSEKICIITIAGSTGAKAAGSLFPLAKTSSAPNFEKGLEELKSGDGKIMIASNVELLKRGGLSSDPGVRVVFGFLTNEKMAMGLRRGDDGFEKLLDAGFRRATLSGEIGKIVGQRFPNVSAGIIDVKNAKTDPGVSLKLEVKQ